MRTLKAVLAAFFGILVFAGTPLAADVRIGVLSEPAVDPQFLCLRVDEQTVAMNARLAP